MNLIAVTIKMRLHSLGKPIGPALHDLGASVNKPLHGTKRMIDSLSNFKATQRKENLLLRCPGLKSLSDKAHKRVSVLNLGAPVSHILNRIKI